MRRTLQPEWLDLLPPTHPDALHNRRDLRWTNVAMRNHAWIAGALTREMILGERVLEVGAGTGDLGLRLARRGIRVDGLDRWPRPAHWPVNHGWHQTDVRTFDRWQDYAVIVGNLIFHQFSDNELRELGARLQTACVIVACEPARRRSSQWAYATLAPLFGANHVSLHDAHVSIAAGFRGRELATLLGLDADRWEARSTTTLLGAYRLLARRRGP